MTRSAIGSFNAGRNAQPEAAPFPPVQPGNPFLRVMTWDAVSLGGAAQQMQP